MWTGPVYHSLPCVSPITGMGEGAPREMAKSGLSVDDMLKFLEDKILEVEKKTTNMLISSENGYPESYFCPHCNKLLREAVQTKSGDRLCDSCFRSIARYVFVEQLM